LPVNADDRQYYIALIRESTTSPEMVTLADRAYNAIASVPSAFGNLKLDYPGDVNFMTFGQVARFEWGCIEYLLRKVLE
jgi:hypothetical protein